MLWYECREPLGNDLGQILVVTKLTTYGQFLPVFAVFLYAYGDIVSGAVGLPRVFTAAWY